MKTSADLLVAIRVIPSDISKSTGLHENLVKRWIATKDVDDYVNYTMRNFMDELEEGISKVKQKLNLISHE